MNLLHIVSSVDPAAGGVSQAISTIIKGLSEKSIENDVVTINDPAAIFLQTMPYSVYAMGPGKTPWQYAPKLLLWLQDNLQYYDAVIVHGLWQYHTYAAHKAWTNMAGKKPKLFVMPHGMLDPYFQRAKGRKLKAIRNWLLWKLVEHKLINSADGILFTCETEKLLAREPFAPYQPKAEKVIGLGVEMPPPYHEKMRTAFEARTHSALPSYWLYISRLHPKKGVDLLIKAYLELKKEQKDFPSLVIAGPGLETPFGKEMQALATGDKNVYFPGMLTGDAKWGAFYGCEVFILPSHQENFGIAVVEALACGKPVLISNQVNIWREIQQGGAGLVANDDFKAVKNLLQDWLLLTPEQKKSIQFRTTTVYKQSFSEAAATQNLSSLLQG